MEVKKARKIIRKVLSECDATEAGIFISMLSFSYMKMCGITDTEFLRSLKNSIKIIGGYEDEQIGKNNEHKKD